MFVLTASLLHLICASICAIHTLVSFCIGPHQFLHKDNKKLLCDLPLFYLPLSLVFVFWPHLSCWSCSHVELPIPEVAELHISTWLVFFYSSALALLLPSLISGMEILLIPSMLWRAQATLFSPEQFTFFTFGPSNFRYLKQLPGVHEC